MEAAFRLAQLGLPDGKQTLLDGLRDPSWTTRSDAAHYLGRIGYAPSLPGLTEIARSDPEPQARNEAIYALEGVGTPSCIAPLVACLDDPEASIRQDARTVLYRLLGESVLTVLSDEMDHYDEETGETQKDPEEVPRVTAWLDHHAGNFDKGMVIYLGVAAHPAVFIEELKRNIDSPMNAILAKLEDWTGESFGATPQKKVLQKWEKWLSGHSEQYKSGERYFYGRLVKEFVP
jgi:hypothetical protein